MNPLKRYPSTAFFILAFVFSLCINVPMVIFSIQVAPLRLLTEFAPTFAALLVTAAISGKTGVRTLLGRVRQWRVNPWWYILVLLGPVVLQLVSIGVFVLLGAPGIQFQFSGLSLLAMLIIGILLSMGEEIGWRGFALPQLQSRYHPVLASLIIGALWFLWHLPGVLPGLPHNTSLLSAVASLITSSNTFWFLVSTLVYSVLMTWVYNRTAGSVLLMVLFHFGLSVLGQLVTTPPQAGQFSPDDLSLVLMGIIAVVVIALTGMKGPSRQKMAQVPSVTLQENNE